MTDISRQVQAAYDQIVLAYADRNHGTMAGNLIALAEQLVQYAGRGAHLIDVGCGTGRDMAWFEAHGLAVTGIDLSSGMLAYARGQVSGDLLAMDMCHLGFHNARFDGAWCCASLLHVPKREASDALGEIRRVLKSDSMLIVSLQEGNGEGWEFDELLQSALSRGGCPTIQFTLPWPKWQFLCHVADHYDLLSRAIIGAADRSFHEEMA